MDNTTPKISLSFTKTLEKKKLQTSALGTEKPETSHSEKEAIAYIDKNLKRFESAKPEDTLVIQLVGSNHEAIYKRIKEKNDLSSASNNLMKVEKKDEEMSLDEKAAAAVIEESSRKLEELRNNTSLQTHVISAVNGESSDKDGEVPTLENYDQFNVDHFGAAMLRGMGWNKDRGVGKNNKRVVEIIDPINKGGLSLTSKKTKVEKSEVEGTDLEELELKKGSQILIESGRNRGSYGIVESIDEDHVLIRLAREEKVVRDVEQNIRVVSAKEYKDFSRVINKAMYDDYKAKEVKKKNELKKEKRTDNSTEARRNKNREEYHKNKGIKSSKRHEELKDTESQPTKQERNFMYNERVEKRLKDKVESVRDEKEEKYNNDRENSYYQRKTLEYEDIKKTKEYKEKKKKYVTEKASNTQSKPSIPWARENLRVRIIDKVFKGGKYHKQKVVIRSIDTIENCTGVTEEGKVLYDINPNHLETVIPKNSSAVVFIVKGNYKGQKARILELHKEEEKATIQLLEESSVILKLYYDDICEYVSR